MRARRRAAIGGRAAVAAAALLAAPACTRQYLDPRVFVQPRPDVGDEEKDAVLRVRSLGVQGFVVSYRDVAVLTPPLYSNPSLGLVLDGKAPLPVKTEAISDSLRPEWLADVRAVLVGHSHYDHGMDLPHVWSRYAPRATVYTSHVGERLFEAAGIDPDHVVDVTAVPSPGGATRDVVDYRSCLSRPKEGCVYAAGQPGDWIEPPGTAGRLRVRALCSRHSPQFAGLPVTWPGCAPRRLPPRSAEDWVLGDTYAWLVEFEDDAGALAFRVYYQDSPTDAAFGYVPSALPAHGAVDVALLCAGAWDQVERNPEGILANTCPRFAVFGHWEDFFEPWDGELKTLRSVDLRELDRRAGAPLQCDGGSAWTGRRFFAVHGGLFVIPPR